MFNFIAGSTKRILTAVKNESGKVGTLTIYGTITSEKWWDSDITPKEVEEKLNELKGVNRIDIFVNSPGGSVFAGLAINNMIKRMNAETVAHVDGLAASIASVIIQAANTVRIPSNAMIMIHNPMAIAMGYASDMRKMADDLDKIREPIMNSYTRFTGKPEALGKMMDDETWMTGDEAVANGFADVADEEKKMAASVDGSMFNLNGITFDTKQYKSFPSNKLAANFLNTQNKTEEDPPADPEKPDYSAEEMRINESQMLLNEKH